jgi:hypothetical protein
MKNIKRLAIVALVFTFGMSLQSCASNRGYKKGKTKKKKRGCNCPKFTAEVISLDKAIAEFS